MQGVIQLQLDTLTTPFKEIVKTLLLIGIPITISSSIMSLTNVIDGMILSSRLQHLGYVEEEAAAMLGNFKTLAVIKVQKERCF